nr:hypothetical protein [Candidatus Nitrospira neomarina]
MKTHPPNPGTVVSVRGSVVDIRVKEHLPPPIRCCAQDRKEESPLRCCLTSTHIAGAELR